VSCLSCQNTALFVVNTCVFFVPVLVWPVPIHSLALSVSLTLTHNWIMELVCVWRDIEEIHLYASHVDSTVSNVSLSAFSAILGISTEAGSVMPTVPRAIER